MAAMPALPSHLGSFFWLVNFRCFLRSEGPSLGATKGGMLWFNQARGLADRRVACAERVCTTASMDSQTLPPFFLLQRRLSKITRFDWSCLCAFARRQEGVTECKYRSPSRTPSACRSVYPKSRRLPSESAAACLTSHQHQSRSGLLQVFKVAMLGLSVFVIPGRVLPDTWHIPLASSN